MTEEERQIVNERALVLREITGVPFMDCKKAAVMYLNDDDALDYLITHDWKIGKLF